MQYLISTKKDGIVYTRNDDSQYQLIGYSDSDFSAGDRETRKTGYVIFSGRPISWCSRKQPMVDLSSTEAEYISAADCVKELLFLKALIDELMNTTVTVTLKIDN